jgi:hypothetical protein
LITASLIKQEEGSKGGQYDDPANRYKNFDVLPEDDVVNVETYRSEVKIS